jgi:hypothetical protein
MAKQLSKQVFGVPSTTVIETTEAEMTASQIQSATFKHQQLIADLERQFQAKAAELRQAYLDEVRGIYGDS